MIRPGRQEQLNMVISAVGLSKYGHACCRQNDFAGHLEGLRGTKVGGDFGLEEPKRVDDGFSHSCSKIVYVENEKVIDWYDQPYPALYSIQQYDYLA